MTKNSLSIIQTHSQDLKREFNLSKVIGDKQTYLGDKQTYF